MQFSIFMLLIVSYIKVRPYKTHGKITTVVTILTLITTLVWMGPSLILNTATLPPTIYLHAIVDSMAFLLGFLFSSRMYKAMKERQPLVCGTKNQMRLLLVLHLVPLLGGIFFYVSTYLPWFGDSRTTFRSL
ncbi:hypothetical protein EU545_04400 [Candidatus Thorarchaeota archaeon]|nr:MAG: hypothetical protein EU545_04400 [Candidatus Thorarchaeota archaeon]